MMQNSVSLITFNNRGFTIALIIFGILGAVSLSFKHLPDELWQDEVYTILRFANKGFFYPFTDYHLPNNHVLFSALLAKWRTLNESTTFLRILPFTIFIITLCSYAFITIRIGGKFAGICALIMFGGSCVTENFAVQLRGYAFSWLPFTLLLLALPQYAKTGRWYWCIVYIIASAMSVVILPTNILFCGIFIFWGWAQIIPDAKTNFKNILGRLGIITIGPFLGFAAYANILLDLFHNSQIKLSTWSPAELLSHWIWSTCYDFIWFFPIITFGLFSLFRNGHKNTDFQIGSTASNIALLKATIFVMVIGMFIFPNPPFPRNFVPLLPIWYFLLGFLFASGWERLFKKKPYLSDVTFIFFIVASFLIVSIRPQYFGESNFNDFPQDLRHQYYHERFYPTRTVILLKNILKRHPTPVMTDFDGIYCLGYVINNFPDLHLDLIHYRRWRDLIGDATLFPKIIVTRSVDSLSNMLMEIGTLPCKYSKIAETGYFKIYSLSADKS